jgi:leucyl-tRNA synthetase
MEYNFKKIEKFWQQAWKQSGIYEVSNFSSKPKCYVLDMFPYPSGTGLHVGHPLGYIASDIYARYKRLKGFNVLHPMGYDSFGLPAEQYALETGQHPAVTTENNIIAFRDQLENIGFSFDWSREIRTSDPKYYKWTQWLFLQIFNSWYDKKQNKARRIDELIKIFEQQGNKADAGQQQIKVIFSAAGWRDFDAGKKHELLMQYRLAYSAPGEVNWCEALGTVLANDEVVNGFSERGGHPVVKRKMRQWYLRITDYAERLLKGLEKVDFTDAMKEMQKNWIGKSEGAEIKLALKFPTRSSIAEKDSQRTERLHDIADQSGHPVSPALRDVEETFIPVYTTRPDTIFGVDFVVLAPEHELVEHITTAGQKNTVEEYLEYVKSRSERERLAEVKQVTGAFTGSYASNPFNGREIPIWVSEYVLAGYGTGAIMAVPSGDQRDFNFARHFHIPVTNIIGDHFTGEEANPTKDAILTNSGFLNGMVMKDAIPVVLGKIEEMAIGERKINFKMRDAGFSRQRYWGEPFPIVYKNGIAYAVDETELPVELPHVETYSTGPEGEGPLANIPEWVHLPGGIKRETNTMPGYAGSSWYFIRYMDPDNDKEFAEKKSTDYWNQVDVYVGGTEHAVGHLLYSRMWTMILYDLGLINFDEPFKKLVNQGMIQGSSRFVYRITGTNQFVSYNLKDKFETDKLRVEVKIVHGIELDIEAFKKWKPEFVSAEFVLENGKYICGTEVEKMSKSKFNTVNPNDLIEKYGADTFRMYEMFLGPVEQSKPWDTKGIEGVHRFLKKLWRLFYDEQKGKVWTEEKAGDTELKVLHRAIKKIEDDTARFSYNTAVSAFMVCVNELSDLKSHKKEILVPLLILIAPYAPHIAEELYWLVNRSSHDEGPPGAKSILDATFPEFESKYLIESEKAYPVSVNGKMRATINMELNVTQQDVEKIVLENDVIQKWIDGKSVKRIIYVKNKMVNVVI